MRDIVAELKAEKAELVSKHSRLDAFTYTDKFRSLGSDYRRALITQYSAMATYISALDERISLHEAGGSEE